MHPVHTHQELLYSLARDGDPSAFYTLVAQFANAAYIAERNLGKSHKEALSVLIPFMKKAYQNFVTTIHQNPFDVWYRDYKKKYYATLDRPSPAADADFESIPMADITHFGAMLDLVLQRQYGKYRRTKKKEIFRRIGTQFTQLHWLIKTAFIFALVGMAAVIALCFLALSKNQLIVTYLSKGASHSVFFPFPGSDQGAMRTFSTNAGDTIDSSAGEKVHDTIKIHDTIRTGPRNYQGSLHGANLSATAGTASTAAPTLKTANPIPSPLKSAIPTTPPPAPVKSAYDSLQ